MGILDDKPRISTPLTLEQKQVQAARRMTQIAKRMLEQIIASHKELLGVVYKNRQGLTPQQVYDGLGADAVEAVTLSRGLQAFVNTATGKTAIDTSEMPELTLNGDGTVTVAVEAVEEVVE